LSFSSEFLIYLFLGFLLKVSDLCLETSTSHSTIENDQNRYVSRDHNIFSELQHAIGSDANRCRSFDSGSDAASSSKIYHNCNHDQSNSEVLTSFIEKDSHTIFELTGSDDCESLNLIENILTSIENMFKPSLFDLANSHGVKFNSKMSSEELKNILSDHLCKGCCFSSMYEGCLQVSSILNKKIMIKMIKLIVLMLEPYLSLIYHICYLKLNYDPFVDFCLNIIFPIHCRTICHLFGGNLKHLSNHYKKVNVRNRNEQTSWRRKKRKKINMNLEL